jgi:hypothetical protein
MPRTVVVARSPEVAEVLRRQGVIGEAAVVDTASRKDVSGARVIGVVPLHLAVLAHSVVRPVFDFGPGERGERLSADALNARYVGVEGYTVSEYRSGVPADLVVTRHSGLVRYLRERSLATQSAPVIAHADADQVSGLVVAGVLPLQLAARTHHVIVVNLRPLPKDLVGQDLPYERMLQQIDGVSRYKVRSI